MIREVKELTLQSSVLLYFIIHFFKPKINKVGKTNGGRE
jgi:hypothetical protein